VIDESGRFSI